MKWLRMTAGQGDGNAKITHGIMYANGSGVLENHVETYVRFSIDVATGYTDISVSRNAKKVLSSMQGCLVTKLVAADQKLAAELFEQTRASKAK